MATSSRLLFDRSRLIAVFYFGFFACSYCFVDTIKSSEMYNFAQIPNFGIPPWTTFMNFVHPPKATCIMPGGALIPSVSSAINPSTITGFIVSVGVYPINILLARRSFPHVGQEIYKAFGTLPSITHLNSATTIIFPGCLVRVIASCFHTNPNSIFWRITHPVPFDGRLTECIPSTFQIIVMAIAKSTGIRQFATPRYGARFLLENNQWCQRSTSTPLRPVATAKTASFNGFLANIKTTFHNSVNYSIQMSRSTV